MSLLPHQKKVAYFSMEIALENNFPSYSGGLGVLAGDTLKSAADLGLPCIAISLLYHKGYFQQKIDKNGNQKTSNVNWNPQDFLQPMPQIAKINLEGKELFLKCWRYVIRGVTGKEVPIFFIDTNLAENALEHQNLTDHLYGGEHRYRLLQEAILGIGGLEILKTLGFTLADSEGYSFHQIGKFHMNEGHAAFLTLSLIKSRLHHTNGTANDEELLNWLRRFAIFTTHTPVPAGHDVFNQSDIHQVLDKAYIDILNRFRCWESNQTLNMTHLAIKFSGFINGVAKRHGEVSSRMFPGQDIHYVTNGVHASTWTAKPIQSLFDQHIPKWREDNFYIRSMLDVPIKEIQAAHQEVKKGLLAILKQRADVQFDPNIFTLGFARRSAEYKRADLMFQDIAQLKQIAEDIGPIQIIFSGKAHPRDLGGQNLIKKIYKHISALKSDKINIVYVENYDMTLGLAITAGVDLWINNPLKPLEASGTSGMKSALNGVPSFSTLDGWWVEGHIEGVTGWVIDDTANAFEQVNEKKKRQLRVEAANVFYRKLKDTIIPIYYTKPEKYGEMMRSTIAINGTHFNTQRMLTQYLTNAYM